MEQIEIERKFLVTGDGWREQAEPTHKFINHVYIVNTPEVAIRTGYVVEYTDDQQVARYGGITIKTPRDGLIRTEIEHEFNGTVGIIVVQALGDSHPRIQKTRYYVKIDDNLQWEIDCFSTEGLQDLVVAEVELPYEGYPDFVKPDWIGEEVTNDPKFSNANLAS